MRKVALITPWPPQQSGIADYALDLAHQLQQSGIRVDIFTSEPHPLSLAGSAIFNARDTRALEKLDGYDEIIYQLGNNTDFHLWMLPLLTQYRGIVHLHDMVMHHIAAWQTWMQGDESSYIRLIERWYGPAGRLKCVQSLESNNYLWDSENVTDFPLCEEYVQHAKAVIVHSDFALQHIRNTLPSIPSLCVPQLYEMLPREGPVSCLKNITILGGVDPQKRLDWVIESAMNLAHRVSLVESPIVIDIAGSIDPRCQHLVEFANKHSTPGLTFKFHGRVSQREFSQLLNKSDLCIALRYPTMGETSAIVMRALQLGVPTVVNNVGWYGELPQGIVKALPVENCVEELTAFLEALWREPEVLCAWSRVCNEAAKDDFSVHGYGALYLRNIHSALFLDWSSGMWADTLRDLEFTGEDKEIAIITEVLGDAIR